MVFQDKLTPPYTTSKISTLDPQQSNCQVTRGKGEKQESRDFDKMFGSDCERQSVT